MLCLPHSQFNMYGSLTVNPFKFLNATIAIHDLVLDDVMSDIDLKNA